MGVRTKTLIIFILVAAIVGGGLVLKIQNGKLFKGLIFGEEGEEVEEGSGEALPDLKPDLEIILPESEEADISVNAVIKNTGEGAVPGGQPFKYTLIINDTEVFSNSDSYSALEPGDSFSFVYPIPKSIYQYPDQGTIKFLLDSENSIKESNENNNEVEKEYNL